MFASWIKIFSIAVLLPHTLHADHSYESTEEDKKPRQRFPKVRTNNHLYSSEYRYHRHHAKDKDYSSEEPSQECQCTCENCTEKPCCDKDTCNECLLQQSSVMLIPYNYPYMMPPYNTAGGSLTPVTTQNITTVATPTTIDTQRLPSPLAAPLKSEERIPSPMSPFYQADGRTAPTQQDLTEQEIIRHYILGKIQEEKLHAMKQIKAEAVRDLQTTPPRRVDKSIFKAVRASVESNNERSNPYEDVERLLQYVKSVRKEKIRPEVNDIHGLKF